MKNQNRNIIDKLIVAAVLAFLIVAVAKGCIPLHLT